ncbi:MAG: hypothetical protein KBT11_05340 [Treponema sp.]|nr:hypothetical protein [Candidatus Treponema equifaecale]
MADSVLTGIERTLILEYLLDGKTSLEVMLQSEENNQTVNPSSRIKILLQDKPKQEKFLKNNILLVKSISGEYKSVLNKEIQVNFYFNNLGLSFFTKLFENNGYYFLTFPEKIIKISDGTKILEGKFSATVFYSGNSYIECDFDENFPLFKKPELSDLDADIQKKICAFIEASIQQAKINKKDIGNGLFLISAGKYLLSKEAASFDSIKGRAKAPALIYIDQDRILFAVKKSDMIFSSDREYQIELNFRLAGPVKRRSVSLSVLVEEIFESPDRTKMVCHTSIKKIMEEDKRFLGDKFLKA